MPDLASYYVYLISSLPMLHFGVKPVVSFERLLRMCDGIIPEADIEILKAMSVSGEACYKKRSAAIRHWHDFDTALRNELVRLKASRRKTEGQKYIRQDGYTDPSITQVAINAVRNPSILESEKILDRERWRMLDELGKEHYFDIDALIVYAYKLLISEKWDKVSTADRGKLLEGALGKA